MSDTEERIRAWAYRLWEEEGRPEGRESVHWERARELVAIEDNQKHTTVPVDEAVANLGPEGEPIEPAETLRNLGEFPTITDQGEFQPPRPQSREGDGRDQEPTHDPESEWGTAGTA